MLPVHCPEVALTVIATPGPRFVPGILNRLLELLPCAGVAFFPARPGCLLDGRPIRTTETRVGAQIVAIAIEQSIVLIRPTAPGSIRFVVAAEVVHQCRVA